jgi:DNA polymerase-1
MPEAQATTPHLLLVDGSSYFYRAFHAMPDLRADPADRSSQPTGAIRGMINMLSALRKQHPEARYAACVYDAHGPTFRDAIYADYKANRTPMPDDLVRQLDPIFEVSALLGWNVLRVPGVEADDVIGTLARAGAEHGLDVVISSGDKDLAQLVTDRITMIDTMNGKRRDVAGVQAEFGVPPALMLDFQNLVGDSIDNVPGVNKVGPKTAAKWLSQYGSLDQIVAHAGEIAGAVGNNLRAALDWLPTARRLLEIRTDCDLAADIPGFPQLDALAFQPPKTVELADFYRQYGFKSLVKSLEAPAMAERAAPGAATAVGTPAVPAATGELKSECVQDWAAFERWFAQIQAADLTAFDTETTSLDDMQARLVGISFSVAPSAACYIPLAHTGPDAGAQLPLSEVLERLKPWFEDAAHKKVGQHIKYDRHVMANHGVTVRGYAHDTMLQSYVLEVNRPHNLTSLAERHLGRGGIQYEDVCGKGAHQIPFAQVPVEEATRYSAEDSEQTLAVHRVLWPRLQADPAQRAIYELEVRCSEVLFQIERHGVLIDGDLLRHQSDELGKRIFALEQEAYKLAGQPFNLGSPKQIGEIFFGKLGLPVVKKTATGQPSTNEEVLEKLAEDYPLPARILEHRGLSKLKGTYTDKLPQLVDPQGRVHTHFAQAVAVTGRLASADPNLQNIPVRTPEGRRIREAFIAPPEHVVLSCDYSQIELRIMAHLSDDAALMKAFHDNVDVHRATASEVFGVAPEQVSSEQRRYAKVINFGLIYGMSSYGLARNLGIDNAAAKNYIDRYFQRYPGVHRYMEETRALAKKQGYVQTVFGRRLYLPEINSPNGPRRAGAERSAINAPMQGTAADLIKKSMVAVQQAIEQGQRASRMVLQVHDELVLEVPDDEVDWARTEVPRLMAGVAQLKVPLLASVGVGPNWEQAH